ncbi:MAG: hypothetical protein AAF202_01550 [Pseudomonadota bacterium]
MRNQEQAFQLSMIELSPRNLSGRGRVVAWSLAFLIVAVFVYTTPYMAAATFAYGCLILGLIERKKRNFHMSLMLTGIVTDIMLVLILEVTRSAIGTAVGDVLNATQYTHIAVSLSAVLLYFPILAYGYFLVGQKKDKKVMRARHMKLGISAFVLRTIGWFTMFSFLDF